MEYKNYWSEDSLRARLGWEANTGKAKQRKEKRQRIKCVSPAKARIYIARSAYMYGFEWDDR